jgi:hypothetical protein
MSEKPKSRKITSVEEVYEDGKLIKQRRSSQIPREPNFIKLYLKDLAHIRELPAWVSGVLYELLKKMDYNNEIVLNSTVKRRIADELGIVSGTIDNALVKFVNKSILFRQGKGVYLANPYLFGKGAWEDVEEIRMKVTYRPTGEADVETEIIDRVMPSALPQMKAAS